MGSRILLKAKYSFYSAIVFFLFANPETLLVLQRILGPTLTVVSSGMTTISGLLLTTTLFFFTMLGLMLLPAE